MLSRELFIYIRFSKKASEKITDKSFDDFKKRLEKEFVPIIHKALKVADKKVKVKVVKG